MIEIVYFGGPKDGAVMRDETVPPAEVYCMDGDGPDIESEMFETTLKNHPSRTLKYHRYALNRVSKNFYRYEFCGLV